MELIPKLKHTTALSSSSNCRDYLSFHVGSERQPQMELCGEQVEERGSYRVISSSSFYAVLWSNDDHFSQGQFNIKARCKTATTKEQK